MEAFIEYALTNFSLVTFLLAMVFSFIVVVAKGGDFTEIDRYNVFLFYLFLLPCGIAGIYGFVLHGFFPDISAETIGWAPSPFQWEVAVANCGFGFVCLVAAWAGHGFRLAALIGITLWFWGDALGHIRQMIVADNYTPGNAGSWFWTDVLIPAFLIVFYSLWRRASRL